MDLSARAVVAGAAPSPSATRELLLQGQSLFLRGALHVALAVGDLEGVRRRLRQMFVLVHTHPEWAAKAMAGSDYLAGLVQNPLYGLEIPLADRDLRTGFGCDGSLEDRMSKLMRSCQKISMSTGIPRKGLTDTSIHDTVDLLHCLRDSVWKIELAMQRASQKCVDDFMLRCPGFRRALDVAKKQCLESCVSRLVPLDATLRQRIKDTLRGFDIWRDAFDELVESRPIAVAHQDLLLIQAFCARFALVACRATEEVGWDRHYQVFVQQIAVVTEYLKLGEYVERREIGPPRPRAHHRSTFGEWGVLRALYLICTRCRDPNTRRKSLQLLAGARRDEGTLSSMALANYAEAIIAAEEGRAGGMSEEALVGGFCVPPEKACVHLPLPRCRSLLASLRTRFRRGRVSRTSWPGTTETTVIRSSLFVDEMSARRGATSSSVATIAARIP